jgi:hypothetical protein
MWRRTRALDLLTDAVIVGGVVAILAAAIAVAWFPGFSMW